jgi:uncharacterized protein YcbK (DUF882 family)
MRRQNGKRRPNAMKGPGVTFQALVLPILAAFALGAAPQAAGPRERTLSFYNIHSNARLTVVYRRGDDYDPRALEQINAILCDPLCGAEHIIDPKVLDFLFDLLQLLDYHGEVHIICGFRTVETNAKLRQQGGGVAQGSLHIQGRALDFRLPGVDSKKVYEKAKAMKRGGTGYYKASDFVHIDTGPVRFW